MKTITLSKGRKRLYYVETRQGCGIRVATSLDAARKSELRYVGTRNFQSCREATDEDVAHVLSMGGHVPEL